jgi:hypothetical protein
MADEVNPAPTGMANLAGQWPVPPTQGVTQFALAANLHEVLLTLGVTRASMQPDAKGTPTPVLGIEWLMSLSLPPSAAKTLQETLAKALERYEELFGKIPADPNARSVMNEPPQGG